VLLHFLENGPAFLLNLAELPDQAADANPGELRAIKRLSSLWQMALHRPDGRTS
jgi:hypothetical protein